MSSLAYLGTPSSLYRGGIEAAFRAAARLTARLLKTGMNVYSPIAHTHPVAVYGKLDPLDHKLWLSFDEAMMERCDSLIVAHLRGWETSQGIFYEMHHFRKAGKPIFDLDPKTLQMVRR